MTIDATPSTLNERFGINDALRFEAGPGNLTQAVIQTADCTGAATLHGGHITQWQPTHTSEVLWLSNQAVYAEGKAIRGGVPVCFPWFGPKADDPDAPAHGLVRTEAWQVTGTALKDDGVHLELAIDIPGWRAVMLAVFGQTLRTDLTVTNTADADASFEAALHTYFTVGDCREVHITGLEHTDYLDKVDQARRKNQGNDPIRFTGETDRVYLDTGADCVLTDTKLGRTITLSKQGSRSTVVWNPWIDKSARMGDFGDNEWPGMCCVETAAVGPDAVTLAAGASHTIGATLSVQRD